MSRMNGCGGRGGPWGFGRGWKGAGRGFRDGGRGFGTRTMLRGAFERLETSPGQERVILTAVEAMQSSAEKFRGELGKTRGDFARAMRQEHFDQAQVRETFGRHDALLAELRETAIGELGKVHEALDDGQRRELADILESWGGRFNGGFGHDYGNRNRNGPGYGRGRWDGEEA